MNLKERTLHLLQNIGLSESEAKLYLTAYKHSGKSIKELQQKSKLSKSSIYRAFESLKSRGLILSGEGAWRQSVEVLPFKKLRTQLVKQQRILKKMELQLEEVESLIGLTAFSHMEEPLEILMNKNDLIEKSQSLLYKGQNHFSVYGSAERLMDVIGREAEDAFIKARVKKGMSGNGCFTEVGHFTQEIMPNNEKELRNIKLIVDENEQNHITYIFEDEAVRWQFDEHLGARAIVIRDPAIVQMCFNKFKKMWAGK